MIGNLREGGREKGKGGKGYIGGEKSDGRREGRGGKGGKHSVIVFVRSDMDGAKKATREENWMK